MILIGKKKITSAITWLVNKKQISRPLSTSQIDQSGAGYSNVFLVN